MTNLERSLHLLGYPDDEIARRVAPQPPDPQIVVERVARIVANFDALSGRRKTAVNPRELIEHIREVLDERTP